MSQRTQHSIKTFTAGEALEAFRRVKLSSGTVVYADAGEEFIGITEEAVASGANVAVALRGSVQTYKAVAAAAVTSGAVIYGAADGKVDDASSGTAQGVALEAATADGDVIEVLFNNGAAGEINGSSTAIGDPTDEGAIPIVFAKQGITDATGSGVTIVTPAFKIRIINWWIISRDTSAANVKLVNVSTDASANKAKGTANDAIVAGGDIIAAQRDVAAGTALKTVASAAQAFDIFVMAIKVA